jgi:hypothetical protein
MLSHERESNAAADAVWRYYASPELWSEWAPHVRSPRGLGVPEVVSGSRGSIRLAGAVPIPAQILDVQTGRSWSWKVGPATLLHTVDPSADGTVIGIRIEAPSALEAVMRVAYMPLVRLLLANLARVAERAA